MRKNKSAIKYFIVASIIIIGILPVINLYPYAVKYDFKKLFNTDRIEMYVNYTFYKVFNKSLEQNKVIVGRDNFLFSGNKYDRILHKTQGLYKYNNNNIDEWANKLKSLQTWYEDRGMKFIIAIAPNKHSIYKEKLPNWVSYDGKTIMDDIVEFSSKKNINMLDVRNFLISKKSDNKLLYPKYGSHWNHYSASLVYEKTIEYLTKLYNVNITKLEYSIFDNLAEGDKYWIKVLKLEEMFSDVYQNEYSFKLKNKVCLGRINRVDFTFSECEQVNNPITYPNDGAKYIINQSAKNQQTLLLIGDSHIGNNSQLYNATFKKVFYWHDAYLQGTRLSNFVQRYKPDIVIYQIVERRLDTSGITTKMPDITMVEYSNNGNKIFDINDIKYKYYTNNGLIITDKNLIATHNDPIITLYRLKTKSKFVRLNLTLDSVVNTTFQLFYKENRNSRYNEKNSYGIAIKKGSNKISLSIPAKYINNKLRVDIVAKKGKYKINDFSIYEERQQAVF